MLKKGLSAYLEENTSWKVTGRYSTSKECLFALRTLGQKNPEFPILAIVDIQLQEENGFNLVSQIKKEFPSLKIVMYSMYDTWGFILQAKDLGVEGYISKVSSDDELVRCLEIVKNGGTYYEKKEESIQNEIDSIVSVLKKQEKIIFEMLLQGKTNNQIKDELFISLHTVENYVSYLLKISGCHNKNELLEKYK